VLIDDCGRIGIRHWLLLLKGESSRRGRRSLLPTGNP
jgi:hypothetical protein